MAQKDRIDFRMKRNVSKERWFRRILIFILLIAISAISNALFNPQEEKAQKADNHTFEIQSQQIRCIVQSAIQWENLDTERNPMILPSFEPLFLQRKVMIKDFGSSDQEQFNFLQEEILTFKDKLLLAQLCVRDVNANNCGIHAA